MGMICGSCGESNRDGARFCSACGNRLVARCATCDVELPDGARFCDACGAPVAPTPSIPGGGGTAAEQSRKTVTVLFADLTGSTAMQERMDPESVRAFSGRYYAAMREVIEASGGRVVKFQGDGVMAVFGVPEVAEDDAVRALRAATAMIDAVRALDVGVALRVGVNTGEVVVDEQDDDVVGDAVNVAARLESAAPVDAVLVGEETYRLARDHATFAAAEALQVKGRNEPVRARLLVDVGGGGVGGDADAVVGFVGRDAELDHLLDALRSCERTGRARLVTVLGSPGVGKSRLLRELDEAVGEGAVVLAGRCDAAGGDTFAPISAVVGAAVESGGLDTLLQDDPERERVERAVAFLLGDGEPGTPEQTFWGVRRVIEAAARQRPLVVVLDDVHWAEPLLLDLVEHLAEWVGEVPVLLVVAARPELREVRPTLVETGTGRPASVLSLEGLDPDATTRLAAELLGSGALPADVEARVVAATEGNPLFVRELVRMLVDDGVVRPEGDGWVATVAPHDIDVPPTISSLLAARVERLRVDERLVLERASVLGHEVVRGALLDLLPATGRAQVDGALESLRRKELLEPAGTYWIDEPVLRFHHALIRDAAYRRLLKEARADLHERAAEWFTAKTGGGSDHDELIGFHLEQAQVNRRQLGPLDERGRDVAAGAAERLARAAHRALHRDDLPAAATLASRALGCLDPGDRGRTDLLLVHCEALLGTGDVAGARPSVEELRSLAAGDERLAAWAAAFTAQLGSLTGTVDLEAAGDEMRDAAAQLTSLGDPTGAAKAHRVRAALLARQGRVADTEAALDQALTAAREADDRRQISGVLAAAPLAALWGPSPVPRAGGRCLDVVRLLRITTGARAVEAISMRCQAVLEALRGRDDAGRKMLRSARRILEDLGLRHGLLELELFAGLVELAAGDPAAAEDHLRLAHEGFRALGVEVDAAQAAALRGRAALAMGEDERALRLAEAAEAMGGHDLKTAIAWRTVKAEVLARRGERGEAVALAQAAVDLAEPTDALVDHADALAALSSVLGRSGDEVGARAAAERARGLYERKGATALAARLGSGPPAPEHVPQAAAGEVERVTTEPEAQPAGAASANAATRWADRWLGQDHPAGEERAFNRYLIVHDLRAGLRATYDRPAHVENLRAVREVGVTGVSRTVVETGGERAALFESRLAGGDGRVVELYLLVVVDQAGRAVYEEIHDDLAMARAALVRESTPVSINAAVAGHRWSAEQTLAKDWDRLVDAASDAMVSLDRRPGLESSLIRDEQLANMQSLPGIGVRSITSEPIDCRGDRLGLLSSRFAGGSGSEEFGVTILGVFELDTHERLARMVLFDETAMAEATAELERRAAGIDLRNDAVYVQEWLTERMLVGDWRRLRRRLHDRARFDDRRRGVASVLDADEMTASLQAVMELGVEQITVAPLATAGDTAALLRIAFSGEGGEYVSTLLSLLTVDADFLVTEAVVYEEDDEAEARAELARRVVVPARAEFDDMQARARQVAELSLARAWDELAELVAPDVVVRDRRPGFGWDVEGREMFLAAQRGIIEVGVTDIATEVLAVRGARGGRAALVISTFSSPETGLTMPTLFVVVVDEAGVMTRSVVFAIDQVIEAVAELEAQGDPPPVATVARAFARAFNERDWDGLRAVCHPDIVHVDHRAVSFGDTHGVGATLERLQGLAELVPEHLVLARWIIEVGEGTMASAGCTRPPPGTEGPVFEYVTVFQVEDGRLVRYEMFDADDVERARARAAELAAG